MQSLCSKLDCDVFIAVVYRSSPVGDFGLRLEALENSRLADQEQESAEYMNAQIEQQVRRFPEQYNWGYRRFSNQVYDAVK